MKILTDILLMVDNKLRKCMNTPWSLTLHEAFLVHCYWTLKLSGKRNDHNYSEQLTKLVQKLKEPQLWMEQSQATYREHKNNFTKFVVRLLLSDKSFLNPSFKLQIW